MLRVQRKKDARIFFTPICFIGIHVLYMLVVFIYAYCPTRFPCHISLNSYTTGVTIGAVTASPLGAHEFIRGFLWGSCCTNLSFSVQQFVNDCLSLCMFLFWPLYCLSFDLRLQITLLVSQIYGFRLPFWHLQTFLLKSDFREPLCQQFPKRKIHIRRTYPVISYTLRYINSVYR